MFLGGHVLHLFHDSVENGSSELRAGDFPAAEEETDFDFVALIEELYSPVQLNL